MLIKICKLFLPSLFMIMSFGCETDLSQETIYGKWEVISLYNYNHIDQEIISDKCVLEIINDSIAKLKLYVNNCTTSYRTINDEDIDFEIFSCTYMCCDSPFSLELKKVLLESKRFEINHNILTIRGMGEVKLRKIDY